MMVRAQFWFPKEYEWEDEASDSVTFSLHQTKYLSANDAKPIWSLTLQEAASGIHPKWQVGGF